MQFDHKFYKGKNVLVTGHTGFKGSWLCRFLTNAGANVTGYALDPPTEPSLYDIADIGRSVDSVYGDIRDIETLSRTFDKARPEIVFHLAAQPIVREGYRSPVYTYEANVMGTVNVLECVRNSASVRSFLNVTTDKVYRNREIERGYTESDELDGTDPYSNSKSCSELVTHCYTDSFLRERGVAVSTVRAGNVIGGGDFARDRIIPDCVRAATAQREIIVRNPHAIRPFQHVLEAIYAYAMIAAAQYDDASLAGAYNVGPDSDGCVEVGELVDLFVKYWEDGVRRVDRPDGGPREACVLKLDCSKLKSTFGWKPRWTLDRAMRAVVEWSKRYINDGGAGEIMDGQIEEYLRS